VRERGYDRAAAVRYARRWAMGRNGAYYDFQDLGGDCTNFASQCLYAGAGVMNYTPVTGWFYRTAADRTASWTGVEYLWRFLVGNEGPGPYARRATRQEIEPGDLVQLGNDRRFYHTPVITAVYPRILVCAHTFDALDRPLDSYESALLRFAHIVGVRA